MFNYRKKELWWFCFTNWQCKVLVVENPPANAWDVRDAGSIPGATTLLICAFLLAQMVKNPPAMWKTWVRPLSWEDPLEEGMATHSSILAWRVPRTEEPGGPHGPWGYKESAMTERLSTAQHIHQQKCFNLGYSVVIMWTRGVFFFGLVMLNLEINFFNVFNLLFLKIVCNFNLLSKYVIDLEMYTPFFYTFLKF